jgi:pyruvate-formate lyase
MIDVRAGYALSPELHALREIALSKKTGWGCPAVVPAEAQAWREHTPDEDWLVWRARRTAAKLRSFPIDLLDGERIVGRPLLWDLTPEEQEPFGEAWKVLESVPAFPGGDTGHFQPDFAKLLSVGIGGIAEEVDARRAVADPGKGAFYDACGIALRGFSDYVLAVADACEAKGWHALADICRNVSFKAPSTFHEAIELMFLALIALWFGEDHALATPGRMDQTLRPFYEADLAAGKITREEAFELICCLYIQLNMILFPGAAISVLVGGRDADGGDVTNDLTYLCLEARAATHLVYPTLAIAWHEGTPLELTDFATDMIATGIGDPAFFNDELISQGLMDLGVTEADSRDYMNSTCVEIKPVGTSNIWVTAPYFNCPEAILLAMDQVADGSAPVDFEQFSAMVRQILAGQVREAAENCDRAWKGRTEHGGFPLASCVISDCLARGLDFDRGGARYNWVENSFVGLANLVDGMMAVKKLVFESGRLSLLEFRDILKADFAGHEQLRQEITHKLPRYGTDNAEADALAIEWADFIQQTSMSNIVGGSPYVPGFFCWIMHGEFGARTGATPDGRKAGTALADGAGAAQGREAAGPTASILSTTKWSHRAAIGGLVHNLRLSGNSLRTPADRAALRALIETYLRRGGFEIQVNVVGADVLRDAQAHPENYADLLVRVAGYSDYFTHLGPVLQEEVIARTEHGTEGPQ